jgi:7-cyano-7-deazaguanine synthase
MDSCVTAAIAAEQYELALLHVQYGQRTQDRELQSFHNIADHYGVKHRLVTNLNHLTLIGGSSLTDPDVAVTEVDLTSQEIPTSYVPFRNAHLLAIATSWAEVLGAVRIFIGAVQEDSSGYPDCRADFFSAYNRVIEMGTKPDTQILIETPLIHLSKSEIVLRGHNLKAPLELTWSCYQAQEKACGHCDSCGLRLRGFFRAALRDPIPYEDDRYRDQYQ